MSFDSTAVPFHSSFGLLVPHGTLTLTVDVLPLKVNACNAESELDLHFG